MCDSEREKERRYDINVQRMPARSLTHPLTHQPCREQDEQKREEKVCNYNAISSSTDQLTN